MNKTFNVKTSLDKSLQLRSIQIKILFLTVRTDYIFQFRKKVYGHVFTTVTLILINKAGILNEQSVLSQI